MNNKRALNIVIVKMLGFNLFKFICIFLIWAASFCNIYAQDPVFSHQESELITGINGHSLSNSLKAILLTYYPMISISKHLRVGLALLYLQMMQGMD